MNIDWRTVLAIVIAGIILKIITVLAFKRVKMYADGSVSQEKETLNVEKAA